MARKVHSDEATALDRLSLIEHSLVAPGTHVHLRISLEHRGRTWAWAHLKFTMPLVSSSFLIRSLTWFRSIGTLFC